MNTLVGWVEKLSEAISHYSGDSLSLNQMIQAAKRFQKYLRQNPLLEEAPELGSIKYYLSSLSLINLENQNNEKILLEIFDKLRPELDKFSYLFEFLNFSSLEKISPTLRYESLQEAYEILLSRKPEDSDWQKIRLWVDREMIRAEKASVRWQEAVGSFLTEQEKRTLEGAYYALMEEPVRRDRLHNEAMRLIELAIKAVFLKLFKELEKGVITPEEANLEVLKTYNYFSLSVVYLAPQRMMALDVAFSRQMSAIFKKGSLLAVQNSLAHDFVTSPEVRTEFLKLLLIQQIVMTAGVAFGTTPHLESAVRILAEHRTMLGKLMHKLFGAKTKSLEIYEDYRRTLDSAITAQEKKTLTDQIQSKIRFKTSRLRKIFSDEESLLIEKQFPEATVHSKGISLVRRSASGVCVTA